MTDRVQTALRTSAALLLLLVLFGIAKLLKVCVHFSSRHPLCACFAIAMASIFTFPCCSRQRHYVVFVAKLVLFVVGIILLLIAFVLWKLLDSVYPLPATSFSIASLLESSFASQTRHVPLSSQSPEFTVDQELDAHASEVMAGVEVVVAIAAVEEHEQEEQVDVEVVAAAPVAVAEEHGSEEQVDVEVVAAAPVAVAEEHEQEEQVDIEVVAAAPVAVAEEHSHEEPEDQKKEQEEEEEVQEEEVVEEKEEQEEPEDDEVEDETVQKDKEDASGVVPVTAAVTTTALTFRPRSRRIQRISISRLYPRLRHHQRHHRPSSLPLATATPSTTVAFAAPTSAPYISRHFQPFRRHTARYNPIARPPRNHRRRRLNSVSLSLRSLAAAFAQQQRSSLPSPAATINTVRHQHPRHHHRRQVTRFHPYLRPPHRHHSRSSSVSALPSTVAIINTVRHQHPRYHHRRQVVRFHPYLRPPSHRFFTA